ncbi:MAG: ATP-binding protein [Deltaproteobacteria bacterium]
MFNSIKIKLVVLFIAVFSFFFAGLEVLLYHELDGLVVSLADEHLKSEVETLANMIIVEEAQHFDISTELSELASAATGVYAEKLSGHYYQIVTPDGKIAVRSPSLSKSDAALPPVRGSEVMDYRTVIGPDNAPLRLVTRTYVFSSGPLTFQAGDSLTDTYRLLSSFRNVVLILFPVAFVLCGAGVFVVTGFALKPLKSFSSRIGRVTEENLNERIDEKGLVRELKPLAGDFNIMLGRLEESFSRQRQFLSNASHELRTPTTIIKSFCDVTLNKERTAGDYREAIARIKDSVDRMCEIIDRTLVISRLDTRTVQFKHEKIDLTDVMKNVIKIIEPSAERRSVVISLNAAPVVVKADREGLIQVFTNIVENAIKYNVENGRIDIGITESNGVAEVRVRDTGIGMPAGEIDKIFDRFYRVDASRNVTVGSGLGLSIVRSIIEAHGGRVEVKSEPGKGSVFTVYLPVNPDIRNGRHSITPP